MPVRDAQRRVRIEHDVVLPTHGQKVGLRAGQVRVVRTLVHGGQRQAGVDDLLQVLHVVVGHPDCPGLALLLQVEERPPGGQTTRGGVVKRAMHLAMRITGVPGACWPMDQHQVDVVGLQITISILRSYMDKLAPMLPNCNSVGGHTLKQIQLKCIDIPDTF